VKHMRSRVAIATVLLIATAACGRSDDGTSSDTTGGPTETSGATESLLSTGGFGDLEDVCQEGDAKGATAKGVTDTEIHVGTVTDKGGPVAGLNEEMYDTAVAFTKWCNEQGGINGRTIVLDDADAKLTAYEAAVTTACSKDFALVGGGAVFDEDPNGVRVGCGLPNIAGYVVSEPARSADLQVQPLPNGMSPINASRYLAAKRDFPDDIAHYGMLSGALPSIQLVRDQLLNVAEGLGYKVDYQVEFAPTGETGWDNFANEIKSKGIKILEYVGQPGDLVTLDKAFDTAGYHPDVVLLSTNFYDSNYVKEAGDSAGTVYIQSGFVPLELADSNPATQDYLDLMSQYNPSGKIAQLGMQGLSSWLLFATAATECGSDLTADCLLEKATAQKGWNAGGLHADQNPGNSDPGPCSLIVSIEDGEFTFNEDATAPTAGDEPYNCDPENVVDVSD
jgi:ABC-type branched-subunit amino acid transport system substrate-binding protein